MSEPSSVTAKIEAHFFDADGTEIGKDSWDGQKLNAQGQYMLTFKDNFRIALIQIGVFK